eukprot:COSAG06_NODE_3936_length_4747_cov_6.077238_1_plen_172_part_00
MQPPFGHCCYAPLGQRTPRARHPAAPQLLRHSACTLTQRAIRPLRLCYEPFGQRTPRARHSAARCMLLWPPAYARTASALPSLATLGNAAGPRARPPRSAPPAQAHVPPGQPGLYIYSPSLVQRLRHTLYTLRHRKGCGSIPATTPATNSPRLDRSRFTQATNSPTQCLTH